MTLYKPLFLQPATGDPNLNYPGAEVRQLIQALVGGTGVRGVIAPAGAVVTQRGAGANFSVDVAAFQGIIDGGDVTDQGSYLVTNSAGGFNVTTPAAPASGSRTHRLVAQVRDKRSNASWTTYDWLPMLLQDTGAGEPARPTSAMTLAHITIAAGAASVTNASIVQGYAVLRSLNPILPVQTLQSGAGAWNSAGGWVDFSGANWTPLSFTVPPSGSVYVTIGGGLTNTAGNNSIGWHISGADTVAHGFPHAFTTSAVGTTRASRRYLVTGLTPGGTDTITPGWFQTSSGNSDTGEGNLMMEPVQ